MTDDDVMIIFDSKGDYKEKFFDSKNQKHVLIAHDVGYKKISKPLEHFRRIKE